MDHIEELARALARLPGIGPRQGKRFVYYLLSASQSERTKLAELIASLNSEVLQCSDCLRFYNDGNKRNRKNKVAVENVCENACENVCHYCSDAARDASQLMIVEKDQDLAVVERAGTYRGKYFVLGGVLTLTGKGTIREKELSLTTQKRLNNNGLKEIVLALSATSEGEHTADHVRTILAPYRDHIKISELGRGLATGSELEYSDAETLRAAITNRKET